MCSYAPNSKEELEFVKSAFNICVRAAEKKLLQGNCTSESNQKALTDAAVDKVSNQKLLQKANAVKLLGGGAGGGKSSNILCDEEDDEDATFNGDANRTTRKPKGKQASGGRQQQQSR